MHKSDWNEPHLAGKPRKFPYAGAYMAILAKALRRYPDDFM